MAITKHTHFNWLVVIYIQSVIVVSIIAEEKQFQYDCFSDSKTGTCEESRVEISGQFYACDLVVKLNTLPKRIGFRNGDIIYSSEGKSYKIGNDGIQEVNEVIPPVGQLFDRKMNTYFGSEGSSYVVESGTGKEVEIITSGKNSYNQHAVDFEANKLFILSYTSNGNPNQKTGNLYTIATDPLHIENDKVNAELVKSVGDRITALAVHSETGILVLGLKEDIGGKLIRLTRQKADPCSRKESYKVAIINLIKEVENKIVSIVTPAPELNRKGNIKNEFENRNTMLKRENQGLQTIYNTTKDRLNMVTSTYKRFSETYQKPILSPPEEAPTKVPYLPPAATSHPPPRPSPPPSRAPPSPPPKVYYQRLATTPRSLPPPYPAYNYAIAKTEYPQPTTTPHPRTNPRPPPPPPPTLRPQSSPRPFPAQLPTRLPPPQRLPPPRVPPPPPPRFPLPPPFPAYNYAIENHNYPKPVTTSQPPRPYPPPTLPPQPAPRPFPAQLPTRLPPPPPPPPSPPPPKPYLPKVTTTPATYRPFPGYSYALATQNHPDPSTPRSTVSENHPVRGEKIPAPDHNDFDGEPNDRPLNCLHLKRQVDELMQREKENQRKFDALLAQLDKITNVNF